MVSVLRDEGATAMACLDAALRDRDAVRRVLLAIVERMEDDQEILNCLWRTITSPALGIGRLTDKDGTPAVFYNKYTLAMLELQGSFERVQYDALVAFLRDFNVVFMYADGTGMGDPVIERLQVLLPHITIEPFRFTTASKSDLFKFYLQEWDAHREFYPAGEQTIQTPTYQRFEQQHLQLEREWNGSYLMCSAPEGEHDDYTCSGALATLATKQVITPVVEIDDGSAMYGRYSPRGAVMGPSNGHLATSRSLRYQRGRGR
jgi:hypothetical protein